MLPSYVCYPDILGYERLSRESLQGSRGAEFLIHLREALSSAYERVREHSKDKDEYQYYATKVFTDNIVVGYPLMERPFYDYGERELADIMDSFAELQVGLAIKGYLVKGYLLRGGIAFGEHYMDDDIVFGPALLEAFGLDQRGGAPRLSLAQSAVTMVRNQLGFYKEPRWAPHRHDLLQDADGTIFLNYLNQAFLAYPEGGIFFDLFEGHKRSVIKGLEDNREMPGIRAKYEWAARYHNFVCRSFAAEYPIPHSPDADEFLALASQEAQKLLGFVIEIEKYFVEPQPLSLRPIRRK
jgi:hypothetical protein